MRENLHTSNHFYQRKQEHKSVERNFRNLYKKKTTYSRKFNLKQTTKITYKAEDFE